MGPASQWMIWFWKLLGEEFAFVDADAGGRACAGVEQVGHDAGVVLVPFGLTLSVSEAPLAGLCARLAPVCAGDFVGVAEVAAFHDVVDADAAVAVVVVVGLPDGAEGVDGDLVVVAEVLGEGLEVGAVEVACGRPCPGGRACPCC